MKYTFLISLLFLIPFSVISAPSLRQSVETLQEQYLLITEQGIGVEETLNLIKNIIKPSDLPKFREGMPCAKHYLISIEEAKGRSRNRIDYIGVHSIWTTVGWHFTGILPTYVYAQWCFDGDEKLIDVVVKKEIDGP